MDKKNLILDRLGFAYSSSPNTPVFESLSAEILLSSTTVIFGANASGKTTLARLIGALDEPASGAILWPPVAKDQSDVEKKVGVVFENPRFQLQAFTVKEELEAGLIYQGLARPEERNLALESVGAELGLEKLFNENIHELEVSEQLAVLTAAFLILRPRLLVLDFSLTLFESSFRDKFLSFIRKNNSPGLVVFTRHAEDLALAGSGSTAFLLEDGLLKELPFEGENELEAVETLRKAHIRMPWYLDLSLLLYREKRLDRIIYKSDKDFVRDYEKLKKEV